MSILPGDDELEALLGGMPVVTSQTAELDGPQHNKKRKIISKNHKTIPPCDRIPSQYVWPDTWALGKGIAHECYGYSSSIFGDTCSHCNRVSSCHKLILSKSSSSFTQGDFGLLFTKLRDIRCSVGEYNSFEVYTFVIKDIQLAGLKMKKIMNSQSICQEDTSLTEKLDILLSNIETLGSIIEKVKKSNNGTILSQSIMIEDHKNFMFQILECRLQIIIASDLAYYRLYYLWMTRKHEKMKPDSMNLKTQYKKHKQNIDMINICLPHPSEYFGCQGLAWDCEGTGKQSQQMFFEQMEEIQENKQHLNQIKKLFLKNWELDKEISDGINPLLFVWQCRWREAVRHFWLSGYCHFKASHLLDLQPPEDQDEVTAFPILSAWRNSCRDPACSLYSFATPTFDAIEAIANLLLQNSNTPLVEVGAGTGYWAKLIQDRLLSSSTSSSKRHQGFPKVVALDIVPPASTEFNEYHGSSPTYMTVHQASAHESVNSYIQSNEYVLMLCYPPPDSSMGLDAIRSHKGKYFIHIGEWTGLTGTIEFQEEVQKRYHLKQSFPLPSWGTDAAYMSIFIRKNVQRNLEQPKEEQKDPLLRCCQCGMQAKYRCRYLRSLVYCNQKCINNHLTFIQLHAAFQMIQFPQLSSKNLISAFQITSKRHFQELSFATLASSSSSSSSTTSATEKSHHINKKKKKKKKKK